MKLQIAIAAVFLSAVISSHSQTADELNAQIDTLNQRIITLRTQLQQSSEYQKLQDEAMKSAKSYDDALSKDPDIGKMDKQIADLKQQTRDIVKARIDKESELAKGDLAKEKAARDDAKNKLVEARRGGELGTTMQQRLDLAAKLAQAQQPKEPQQ